jgi:hypothetical protein
VRSEREFAAILAPAGLEIEAVTRTPIVDVCLLQVVRCR